MNPGIHEIVKSQPWFHLAFAETVALSLILGGNFAQSVVQREVSIANIVPVLHSARNKHNERTL